MTANVNRRAVSALLGVLALYAALVLTHRGEFWPFSVFPMYSPGRKSWSRPMIRQVHVGFEAWHVTGLDDLPGEEFSLFTNGVKRNELRRAFDTSSTWGRDEIASLRPLVGEENIRGRRLLVMNVKGRLAPEGAVSVECFPLAILTQDGTQLNPLIER